MSNPEALTVADATLLLPGPAARGHGEGYVGVLAAPFIGADEDVFWLVRASQDLGDAAGGAVDLLGDWSVEDRQGLDDSEYRRIVAGRRVALASGCTPAALWRAWELLTEPIGDATMTEDTLEMTLLAVSRWVPSDSWRLRAQDVLRAIRPLGTYFYGRVDTVDCFRWDETGFEVGFSADLGA